MALLVFEYMVLWLKTSRLTEHVKVMILTSSFGCIWYSSPSHLIVCCILFWFHGSFLWWTLKNISFLRLIFILIYFQIHRIFSHRLNFFFLFLHSRVFEGLIVKGTGFLPPFWMHLIFMFIPFNCLLRAILIPWFISFHIDVHIYLHFDFVLFHIDVDIDYGKNVISLWDGNFFFSYLMHSTTSIVFVLCFLLFFQFCWYEGFLDIYKILISSSISDFSDIYFSK